MTQPRKDEITQEELKKIVKYDDSSGQLIYIVTRQYSAQKGSVAGSVFRKKGYRYIKIHGKVYGAHRLVWIYNFGKIKEGMFVDHIDQNKLNNRIENLQLVTNQQNQRNAKKKIDNTSGVTGVSYIPKDKKWRAYITVDRKFKHLGVFKNKSDAIKKRKEEEKKFGFSELHGS